LCENTKGVTNRKRLRRTALEGTATKWDYIFCGILDRILVQHCTKFPNEKNVLQLVRHMINELWYQSYEKRLEQQKGRSKCQMLMFALQKKIWKRNYNKISIRL